MKFFIGFMLGLGIVSAIGQTNFGVLPITGQVPIVKVDVDGYVICSDERKP
jgi:hypothetical protein